MSFINEKFMLKNKTAEKLYNDYAKDMPIIDYHCHLSPKMIADNYKFDNIGELLLGCDHYKWRAMRSNGIDEKYITGNASYYEKFLKWAETVPYTIGNPLLHWNQLELKKFFGIDEILCQETADIIWKKCNELLKTEAFSARNLIKNSNVKVVCTTDDPMDDLKYHIQLRDEKYEVKVLPTFRPDKAVEIGRETFLPYIKKMNVNSYDEFLKVLIDRLHFFNENGCRVSDHAMEYVPYAIGNAKNIFDKKLSGESLTKKEQDIFKTAVLKKCAKEYVKLGWAMQLHIGALRNNNTYMYNKLGSDVGYDSINDLCIAEPLAKFMDCLEQDNCLPKTILYTLNPKDNYVLGTMLGNFQKGPIAGKIQFGSGWWFNDQRDGMIEQMKSLSNLGLLSKFVGMLTDSRSFVSYTRHDYFRRILCTLIGQWVEEGEYPEDYKMLEEIIKGICYNNAKTYFGF